MVVFYSSSVIGCFLSTHPGILDPFYVKFIAFINWLRSIVAICEKKWICLPGFKPKPPAHQASRNLRWDTECSVVFSFNLLTRLNTNKILTLFCQWKWGNCGAHYKSCRCASFLSQNLLNIHQTLLVGPAESFMQKMNLIKVCVARLLSLNSDDLYFSLYDIFTLCCTETVYNSEIYIVVFLYDIDILYFCTVYSICFILCVKFLKRNSVKAQHTENN